MPNAPKEYFAWFVTLFRRPADHQSHTFVVVLLGFTVCYGQRRVVLDHTIMIKYFVISKTVLSKILSNV
jgi:hypothetical protein